MSQIDKESILESKDVDEGESEVESCFSGPRSYARWVSILSILNSSTRSSRSSEILNRLIHFYFGVNLDIVWDVVRNKVPALRECLLKILTELQ
ncbi:MAG: DUF86 domain-containing protein [Candidatus Korarchaeota archaeon]|nr:DUF86 domain-containing protein [Candidatus Korarchaeota archaeon]